MIRTPQLAARRVRQTFSFANGPQILWDLAAGRTPWGPEDLRFTTRAGVTIVCPNVPGARVPVYELFVEDAYRLDDLTRGLPSDFTTLDIGGQVGCFSTALAKHSPKARIHAYEASPTTASWLLRNVEGNGIADRVTVHNVALSDHRGTLTFADNGSGSGQNGLTAPEGTTTEIEVPCVTFADAVAEAGGRVDLVKLDTEGAEYDIVLSGSPADWAGVQRMVLEYHPVQGHSWSELEAFLATAGLTATRHEEAGVGLGTVWLSREG